MKLIIAMVAGVLAQPVHTPATPKADPPRQVAAAPFAITISGGVSLGVYEAGLLWTVIRSMKYPVGLGDWPKPKLVTLTGASAGSINALLGAALWCSTDANDADVEHNALHETWVDLGAARLLASTDAVSKQAAERAAGKPADAGVLSREAFKAAETSIQDRYFSSNAKHFCDHVKVGMAVTPVVARTLATVSGVEAKRQVDYFQFDFWANGKAIEIRNDWMLRRNPALQLPLLPDGTVAFMGGADAVTSVLRASSAFPFAFSPQEVAYCVSPAPGTNRCAAGVPGSAAKCPTGVVRSEAFMDGGFLDNMPLELAVDLMRETAEQASVNADPAGGARFLLIDPDKRRNPDPGKRQSDDADACRQQSPAFLSLATHTANVMSVVATARSALLSEALAAQGWDVSLAGFKTRLNDAGEVLTDASDLVGRPASVSDRAGPPQLIQALRNIGDGRESDFPKKDQWAHLGGLLKSAAKAAEKLDKADMAEAERLAKKLSLEIGNVRAVVVEWRQSQVAKELTHTARLAGELGGMICAPASADPLCALLAGFAAKPALELIVQLQTEVLTVSTQYECTPPPAGAGVPSTAPGGLAAKVPFCREGAPAETVKTKAVELAVALQSVRKNDDARARDRSNVEARLAEVAMKLRDPIPRGRELIPSTRFAPLVGDKLMGFGAFASRTFREADYAAGVYEGLQGIAQFRWSTGHTPPKDDPLFQGIDCLGKKESEIDPACLGAWMGVTARSLGLTSGSVGAAGDVLAVIRTLACEELRASKRDGALAHNAWSWLGAVPAAGAPCAPAALPRDSPAAVVGALFHGKDPRSRARDDVSLGEVVEALGMDGVRLETPGVDDVRAGPRGVGRGSWWAARVASHALNSQRELEDPTHDKQTRSVLMLARHAADTVEANSIRREPLVEGRFGTFRMRETLLSSGDTPMSYLLQAAPYSVGYDFTSKMVRLALIQPTLRLPTISPFGLEVSDLYLRTTANVEWGFDQRRAWGSVPLMLGMDVFGALSLAAGPEYRWSFSRLDGGGFGALIDLGILENTHIEWRTQGQFSVSLRFDDLAGVAFWHLTR